MNCLISFPRILTYNINENILTDYSIGNIYYIIKRVYVIPKIDRKKSSLKYIKDKTKKIGKNFLLCSLIYSLSYNGIYKFRKKNDMLNKAFAGFSTGFIMNYKYGLNYSFKSGLTNSIFLIFIEGIRNYRRKKLFNDENKIIKYYKEEFNKKGIQF